MEYTSIVGRVTGSMPQPVPGRGLMRGPLEFQTAIAHASLTDGKRIAALRRQADAMRAVWNGPLPPRIAAMPERIPYGSLPGQPLMLGLSYASMEPVCLPLAQTTGLLISAGDAPSRQSLLTLLLRQASAVPDIQILLYSPVLSCPGARQLHTPEELDEALLPLVQELRARQKAYRADASRVFSPILIVVDDCVSCLSAAQLDTTSRLEVFIRLGRGLGITVVAADSASAVSSRYYGNDILMATLQAGPILLTGGCAQDHRIVNTIALEKAASSLFTEGNLVLANEEKFDIIKQIDCND